MDMFVPLLIIILGNRQKAQKEAAKRQKNGSQLKARAAGRIKKKIGRSYYYISIYY